MCTKYIKVSERTNEWTSKGACWQWCLCVTIVRHFFVTVQKHNTQCALLSCRRRYCCCCYCCCCWCAPCWCWCCWCRGCLPLLFQLILSLSLCLSLNASIQYLDGVFLFLFFFLLSTQAIDDKAVFIHPSTTFIKVCVPTLDGMSFLVWHGIRCLMHILYTQIHTTILMTPIRIIEKFI